MLQNSSTNPTSLSGLWVLLVDRSEEASAAVEGQVPMMARSGDEQNFLLGFKNAANARQFLSESDIEGAEPRLVVQSNKEQLIDVARANGAVGFLVDYNPTTREYAAAAAL